MADRPLLVLVPRVRPPAPGPTLSAALPLDQLQVNAWDVYRDGDAPPEVRQRALSRIAAASRGGPVPPWEESDRPYLARHVIYACVAHDEQVLPFGESWRHLSDGRRCPPSGVDR